MTPEQKAKELVHKCRTFCVMWSGGVEIEEHNVKQCALLAVDEVIEALTPLRGLWSVDMVDPIAYWKAVKRNIF